MDFFKFMFGLKGADKKQIVGLAVTPGLGLEACVYERETGEVVKYGQKFLEYNIASKEIQDINNFRSSVTDIFNELDISKENSNVYLVLPNVHFGFRSIEDLTIDNEAIESMILSDAGESYIFKQEEPISAWADMNAKTGATTKYIAHSSLQRKAVDSIQDAMMDLGITIVGVEGATTAIPRGVYLTKLCDDVISNNQNWDILLINPNGYSIFQMSGSRILDYVEIPFAIMSFEGDEVYSALSSAIAQYLPNYPAKKLVVTSLTDNVSAEILKNEIVFEEEIIAIDSNSFGKKPYMPLGPDVMKQAASSMSLCALGASAPKCGGLATLNVLGDISYDGVVTYGSINIGGNEIDITSSVIAKFSLYMSAALLVLTLIVCGLFGTIGGIYGAKLSSVEQKVNALNTEVSALNNQLRANIGALIKQISENNKTSLNYYDSLSSDIPPHVWLTYYINKNGKDVGIEGFSIEIGDIYEYYKSLKILAPKSDIKLNKLEVFKDENENNDGNADDMVLLEDNKQQTFAFEISNTSYSKTFDENGNKIQKESSDKNKKSQPAPQNNSANNINNISTKTAPQDSFAAKIPNIPDVEINLKEIK